MSGNLQAEIAAVQAAAGDGPAQYLTFMLGAEMFAVGILGIKEIIEYDKLTTVPLMPRHVRGVINLRGAVVPVLDLASRFGRPPTETGRRTCIVIVEVALDAERQVVGLLVDAVNEVLDIPAAQIEPAPSFGMGIGGDFIAGMGKVGGAFVIILRVEHLLSGTMAAAAAAAADGPVREAALA